MWQSARFDEAADQSVVLSLASQELTLLHDEVGRQGISYMTHAGMPSVCCVQDAIDRIKSLEQMGHLTGVMDDRGKVCHLSTC